MAGVKAGSADSFRQLHERYEHRAYRIARSVCRDDCRAQEVVQEAFLSIWRTAMHYEHRRGVAPWLLTVVRNRAIDEARRNSQHALHRASDDRLDALGAPDCVAAQVIADDVSHHLSSLLARLPSEQQEVITLAFFEQLSHSEIASLLNVPLGTVKGRIRLGMERMRGGMDGIR